MREENKIKKLGLSIYPSKNTIKEMEDYLKLGNKYGFTKVFTSLLEVTENNKEKVLSKMKNLFQFANNLGYEISLDVNPKILKLLNIELPNLSFFQNLGVNSLRLDENYNGIIEKEISLNEFGIKIEVNASAIYNLINVMLETKTIKNSIIASHNFYPQRYSGLSLEYFLKTTNHFKERGIKTSCFVSSGVGETGPWNVEEGLPTLEIHRDLPIETQVKHLYILGNVDEIIIGNAFASEEEMKAISKLNPNILKLDIDLDKKISLTEKRIALEYNNHFRRGDINEYTVRSTRSRYIYKEEKIPKRSYNKKQEFGDVFIPNELYSKYKGELQIVLKTMPIEERKNFVGKIVEHEKFLINYIDSWDSFILNEYKGSTKNKWKK